MGVTSFSYEFDCPVPPARMFKALVLDSHNLFPKLMPQAIKSVEFVQGDGGSAGSIKQTNFNEAARFKCMKERIDGIDKENFACKYTIIEGDMLNDKSVESISYEVKFEASADGGCVCRMKSEYHTVGGFEFKEEEIKAKKEKAMAMYKAVEAFLLKNPDAYH